MAYCPECGVEVEDAARRCPLCDAPIPRRGETEGAPGYPARPSLSPRQGRQLAWLATSALLLSAALACVVVNVLGDGAISWALYPVTGLAVAWLYLTLVLAFIRRPVAVIAGQAVATGGFLALVDLFDGTLDWFVPLALPIVVVVSAVTTAILLVARRSRGAPALVAIAVLGGGAATSVAVDLLVARHLGATGPTWSLIVLAGLAPILLLLVHLHRRLGGGLRLERFLHR